MIGIILCFYQRISITGNASAVGMNNDAVIFVIVSLLMHLVDKTVLMPVINAGIKFNVRIYFFHRFIIIDKSRLICLIIAGNLRPPRRNIAVCPVSESNFTRLVIKCAHILCSFARQRIYHFPLCSCNKYFRRILYNRKIIHITFLIRISVAQRRRRSPITLLCHFVVGLIIAGLSGNRHSVAFNIKIHNALVIFAESRHPIILPRIAEFIAKFKPYNAIRFFMPVFRAHSRPVCSAVRIASVVGRV